MEFHEEPADRTMVICRGLPGSGKTTMARRIGRGGAVFSADDFFMVDGRYVYRRPLVGQAHIWNEARARRAMAAGITPVVIDNTTIRATDATRYVRLARTFGYRIVVREPDTWWRFDVTELAKRNRHNVPEHVIRAMLRQWEPELCFER